MGALHEGHMGLLLPEGLSVARERAVVGRSLQNAQPTSWLDSEPQAEGRCPPMSRDLCVDTTIHGRKDAKHREMLKVKLPVKIK